MSIQQAEAARPAQATPLISVRSLSKSFSGSGGRPIPVLDNINLDVAEGEFVALLGRSGSGKSTLLRCIAGLMAPTSGEVLFRGNRLTGTNRETSMVFQTFALMPWLTVQQNVELGLEARGIPAGERTDRALRAIDIVGLDGYESAYPKELSGGMRQRVGFARALVVEPAALLMDEPFSALDVLTSENLRGELLELWEGHRFPTKTIVMVTHNIEEAVLLADRILVLGTNPGRIRSDIVNPLPRPRRRRTTDFDELVDQIYRLMTKPDEQPAAVGGPGPGAGTISDTPLPHATVDGLSGLAEILLAMHGGSADLADLAESLGLEVDDLLPLVDALVLLGFADLRDDRLELSANGKVFAGASIQESKQIFARACLERAPLVRTIYRSLRGTTDDTLPAGFFLDILRTSFGEEEAAQQLDVAINWGRYAELYDYDAARGQIIREEQGIGATIADEPEPPSRGSLTVYLGAAPGSGKTYTMLKEGRKVRALGDDVVIGFADVRGRQHTQEAIGGLEIVPPADGQMDVAAVLARKPAVALVDDLGAHLAGVEALRSSGVHVISTADVADVQRTAADVEAVTGVPPRAAISDEVLAGIDALQFVDSSPEALRKRLGHGNIYPLDRIEAGAARRVPARAARCAARDRAAAGRPERARVRRCSADRRTCWSRSGGRTRPIRSSGGACGSPAVAARAAPCSRSSSRSRRARRRWPWLSGSRRPRRSAAPRSCSGTAATRARRSSPPSRSCNARHLVLAVPTAGMLERWRVTLLERLAGQLPRVHLHIEAAAGSATILPRPAVPRPPAAGRTAAAERSGSTSATRQAAARRRRCSRRRTGVTLAARTWSSAPSTRQTAKTSPPSLSTCS